jgi:hypothetical protein
MTEGMNKSLSNHEFWTFEFACYVREEVFVLIISLFTIHFS